MLQKVEEYIYEIFETILPGFLAIVLFSMTVLLSMNKELLRRIWANLDLENRAISLFVPAGERFVHLFDNNYGRTVLLVIIVLLSYMAGVCMSQIARQMMKWGWFKVRCNYFYKENVGIRDEVRARLIREYPIDRNDFDRAGGIVYFRWAQLLDGQNSRRLFRLNAKDVFFRTMMTLNALCAALSFILLIINLNNAPMTGVTRPGLSVLFLGVYLGAFFLFRKGYAESLCYTINEAILQLAKYFREVDGNAVNGESSG